MSESLSNGFYFKASHCYFFGVETLRPVMQKRLPERVNFHVPANSINRVYSDTLDFQHVRAGSTYAYRSPESFGCLLKVGECSATPFPAPKSTAKLTSPV